MVDQREFETFKAKIGLPESFKDEHENAIMAMYTFLTTKLDEAVTEYTAAVQSDPPRNAELYGSACLILGSTYRGFFNKPPPLPEGFPFQVFFPNTLSGEANTSLPQSSAAEAPETTSPLSELLMNFVLEQIRCDESLEDMEPHNLMTEMCERLLKTTVEAVQSLFPQDATFEQTDVNNIEQEMEPAIRRALIAETLATLGDGDSTIRPTEPTATARQSDIEQIIKPYQRWIQAATNAAATMYTVASDDGARASALWSIRHFAPLAFPTGQFPCSWDRNVREEAKRAWDKRRGVSSVL